MKKLSVGVAGLLSTAALFAVAPGISLASTHVRAHDSSTPPALATSTSPAPTVAPTPASLPSGECEYEAMPNPGTPLYIRKTTSTTAASVGTYAYGDAVFATCDYTSANGEDWVHTYNSPSQTQGWVNTFYLLLEEG